MAEGHGRFSDPAIERDFRLSERRSRIPTVRLYGLLTLGLLLAYALVNPLFFSDENVVRFTILVAASLVVLGTYVALTFWDLYPEHPAIDFLCLLALGLLILVANVVLWHEAAARAGGARYANVAISNATVCAFAAIVMAERMRRFAAWLGCHAVAFAAFMLLLETSLAGRVYAALSYLTGAAIALFINWALGRAHRTAYALRAALEAERAKSEELLYNVLPEAAAKRLREGQIVADAYSDASVVFADVVGFSRLAGTVSPGHLIELLNAFFNLADRCAAEHGIEKVKTIGDAYLAVSGGNVAAANSADAALAFAQAVIAGLEDVRETTGLPLEVRIGIHSGPVVGGVIGATRMAYDYWGETMNMASRIEGQAGPNGIAVSESTYLRTRLKPLFGPAERVQLKGVGEVAVYRLNEGA
ncbi:MAG: adenylate/guanylate cyclase domain-containing protein [Allosphingosinicella sp.]